MNLMRFIHQQKKKKKKKNVSHLLCACLKSHYYSKITKKVI